MELRAIYDGLGLTALVREARLASVLQECRPAAMKATGQRRQGAHPLAPPARVLGALGRTQATPRNRQFGQSRYCCSQVGRYNTQPRHDERGWLCSAFGVDGNGHDAMVRHGSVASAGAATPVAAASPPARRVPSRTMAFPMT